MSKVCLCHCVTVLAGAKQYVLLCVTDDCCRWFVELESADTDQLLCLVCSSVLTVCMLLIDWASLCCQILDFSISQDSQAGANKPRTANVSTDYKKQ